MRAEFEALVTRQRTHAEAWTRSVDATQAQHAQRAHDLDTRQTALDDRARELEEVAARLETMRQEVQRDAAAGQQALEEMQVQRSKLRQRVQAVEAHEQQLEAWKVEFKAQAAAQLSAREQVLQEWERRVAMQEEVGCTCGVVFYTQIHTNTHLCTFQHIPTHTNTHYRP